MDRSKADQTLTFARTPNGQKLLVFTGWARDSRSLLAKGIPDLCRLPGVNVTWIVADPGLSGGKADQSACKGTGDAAGPKKIANELFAKTDNLLTATTKVPDQELARLMSTQVEDVRGLLDAIRSRDLATAKKQAAKAQQSASATLKRFGDLNKAVNGSQPSAGGKCARYANPDPSQIADDLSDAVAALEYCDPDHSYCFYTGGSLIVGTSGDDVLIGTDQAETICGLGGNDFIVGGGGVDYSRDGWAWEGDSISGGPGNDTIIGSAWGEAMRGNDGNDLLVGANACFSPNVISNSCYDVLDGDTNSIGGATTKDSGDDVLIGGLVTVRSDLWGGPGNDLIAASPIAALPPFGNSIVAGDGRDVVMAMNFSPNSDDIRLKRWEFTLPKVKIPLTSACSVTLELSTQDKKKDKGSVSCSLPWPKKLSGLDQVVPMSASVDKDGKVAFGATLYNDLGKLSVSSMGGMLQAQASLPDDVCICDPLKDTPPTTTPEIWMPWDWKQD